MTAAVTDFIHFKPSVRRTRLAFSGQSGHRNDFSAIGAIAEKFWSITVYPLLTNSRRPSAPTSSSATASNPIRAGIAFSFNSARSCAQTPIKMHAIIRCPALADSAVASWSRSRHLDLSDRCGGIVAAEVRRSRLDGGHCSHGGAQRPENDQKLQPSWHSASHVIVIRPARLCTIGHELHKIWPPAARAMCARLSPNPIDEAAV
jgi:hypothetical protein